MWMPIVIKKGRRYSTGICTSTLICQACYSKINSSVLQGEFLSNIHSFSMNFYVTGLFNKILKINVDFCIWEIRDKERCQKLHNWSNCAQIKINDPLFVPNDENFVFFVKKSRVSYIWNSDKQTAMIPPYRYFLILTIHLKCLPFTRICTFQKYLIQSCFALLLFLRS